MSNSSVQIHFQEADLGDVLASYVKGFKPPNDGVILKWDASVDPSTRKVWFKLTVEMPVSLNDNGKLLRFPKKIIVP